MENPTPQEQVTKTCEYGSDHVTYEQYSAQVNWRAKLVKQAVSSDTLTALKSLIRDGELDRETAVTVYNAIANETGWDTVESINTSYTVTVTAFGQTLGEFTDVEASNEDEAVEIVQNDYEVNSADLSLDISYGSESVYGSVELTNTWSIDLNEFIEFEAIGND